jgi:hypothetical protein
MAENCFPIVSFERTTVIILRRAPNVSVGAHTTPTGHISLSKTTEIVEWDIADNDAIDMDRGVSCPCVFIRLPTDRPDERKIAAAGIETGKEKGPWMTC